MSTIATLKRTINLTLKKKVLDLPRTADLKNMNIVVTGATGGLGKCVVETLLQNGATVIGIARSNKTEINNQKYTQIACDIIREDQVKSAFNEIASKYPNIDVLINNAALTYEKTFDEITSQDLTDYLGTNISGLFYVTQAVLPFMKKNKKGLVLNIGSKISRNLMVGKNKTLYATTKYAIEGFTNSLKNELKEFGIRVICLLPATMNTFVSLNAGNHLSPYTVAQIVCDVIKYEDVDFENFVVKNKYQEI